jgi:Dihydropteroate synthase and related enzymes
VGEGLVASLERYKKIREKFKDIPLFFGVGNVSELIDADSVGVNAILSGLASELNADILFTPEYSQKCFGSIYELRRASEMMFLSENRGMPPKDLGIDLLLFKEKRKRRVFFRRPRSLRQKRRRSGRSIHLGGS